MDNEIIIEKAKSKETYGTLLAGEVPEVSIIIPCFNESAGVGQTTEAILQYCKAKLPHYSFELILVNDGSTDDTMSQIRALSKIYSSVKPVDLKINRGRGAALKAGLAASRGSYVITLDADLSYDVEHIENILRVFELTPGTDAVIISAFMEGGFVQGVPYKRLIVSKIANRILSGFFDRKLSTVTCVARGYRGPVIRSLPLFEDNKEFHLEVLRKLDLCGARIAEIPGRLVWKEKKIRAARKGGIKVMSAARKHLTYAFLIQPARLFKIIASLLLLGSFYEFLMISFSFGKFYRPDRFNFLYGIWQALYLTFNHSPHSFFIASLSLLLGTQAFSYLAILNVLKLQQEETLRHLVAILQSKSPTLPHSEPEFNN